MFQEIANHLEEGAGIDASTMKFSEAFDLLPRHWLLTKLAATGVDSCAVV